MLPNRCHAWRVRTANIALLTRWCAGAVAMAPQMYLLARACGWVTSMRIGYAHADSLLTYPDADNLSASSQPIRVGYRLSGVKQCCETCWRRALTVGEGGCFGGRVWHAIRGGSERCVSTSMARVAQQQCHRFAHVRCGGSPAHTVRPALARRNPAARASSIGGSIGGTAASRVSR